MMKKTAVGEDEKVAKEKRDEEIKGKLETIKQSIIDKNKTRPKILISDVPDSFNKLITHKKVLGPALIQVYKYNIASS